jgi:hypothetical protein
MDSLAVEYVDALAVRFSPSYSMECTLFLSSQSLPACPSGKRSITKMSMEQ